MERGIQYQTPPNPFMLHMLTHHPASLTPKPRQHAVHVTTFPIPFTLARDTRKHATHTIHARILLRQALHSHLIVSSLKEKFKTQTSKRSKQMYSFLPKFTSQVSYRFIALQKNKLCQDTFVKCLSLRSADIAHDHKWHPSYLCRK